MSGVEAVFSWRSSRRIGWVRFLKRRCFVVATSTRSGLRYLRGSSVIKAASTWRARKFAWGSGVVGVGCSARGRGQVATKASSNSAIPDTLEYVLTAAFGSDWKWTYSLVAPCLSTGSLATILAFLQCVREAITPVLPVLLPVRGLSLLCAQPARSMYYSTIGIGGIGVIGDFGLERLDVVVLMIAMVFSCNFRLDKLGSLLVNGLVDNGYQIQPAPSGDVWASIPTLCDMRMVRHINFVPQIPSGRQRQMFHCFSLLDLGV